MAETLTTLTVVASDVFFGGLINILCDKFLGDYEESKGIFLNAFEVIAEVTLKVLAYREVRSVIPWYPSPGNDPTGEIVLSLFLNSSPRFMNKINDVSKDFVDLIDKAFIFKTKNVNTPAPASQ